MINKKFILIAEDDPAYGSVYKAKLEKEGYEVTLVPRGDEVLAVLKERKPDLMILDLLMPGRNGFEILSDMQSDPNLKDIKCIVASNLSQDVDHEKALKNGAIDFFVKSDISIIDMVDKIKSHL